VLLGLAIPPELSKSVCELATNLHDGSPRSRGESLRARAARPTVQKLHSAEARCQLQRRWPCTRRARSNVADSDEMCYSTALWKTTRPRHHGRMTATSTICRHLIDPKESREFLKLAVSINVLTRGLPQMREHWRCHHLCSMSTLPTKFCIPGEGFSSTLRLLSSVCSLQ
jgi:hypothetical protein